MMKNKALSNLGLAMRAGKLSTGDEIVLSAIQSGSARLVIIATDASPNTRKKFEDKCKHYHIPIVEIADRYELGASIGKSERVLVSVDDPGFAKMIHQCIGNSMEVKGID